MATQDLNADIIAQIAAQQLGAAPAPAAAQQTPGAQTSTPAPQNPKPAADPSPTDMEKAQSKLSPKDADALSDEEAIRVIKLGDKEFTESQLTGTMSRYRDLNYRWQSEVAPISPVLEVVNSMMKAAKEAGANPDPKELAKLIDSAVRAYVKNPQLGGDGGQANQQNGKAKPPMSDSQKGDGEDDSDEVYEAWEKENAVTLPPGFKNIAKANREMSTKMQAMLDMMQTLLTGQGNGQNAVATAQQTMDQAQALNAQAATGMIRNNLNTAFSTAQIPLDDATKADFRMFAAQRGYDFPDFMDPQLTQTVVADYKANKDAPEMARLRQIAAKRQAFTGMDGASPGAGAAPAKPAADPMFASMVQSAMDGRGIR